MVDREECVGVFDLGGWMVLKRRGDKNKILFVVTQFYLFSLETSCKLCGLDTWVKTVGSEFWLVWNKGL